MHDEVCWLLFGLIRFYKPAVVIQAGHLWGKSALVVLEAMCADPELDSGPMGDSEYASFVSHNSPSDGRGELHSVDPKPQGVPNPDAGIKLLKKWYPGAFHFHPQDSEEFFANLDPPDARLFGIVDGDHTPAGCRADLEALADLGAGMVFLDDTAWVPTLAECGRALQLRGYSVMEFPDYNGCVVLVK